VKLAAGGFEQVAGSLFGKQFPARVAQLVEHTLGKGEVIGSIPIASLFLNDTDLRKK
jgi:hypothetical protein